MKCKYISRYDLENLISILCILSIAITPLAWIAFMASDEPHISAWWALLTPVVMVLITLLCIASAALIQIFHIGDHIENFARWLSNKLCSDSEDD